jgi:hypothetical protein
LGQPAGNIEGAGGCCAIAAAAHINSSKNMASRSSYQPIWFGEYSEYSYPSRITGQSSVSAV